MASIFIRVGRPECRPLNVRLVSLYSSLALSPLLGGSDPGWLLERRIAAPGTWCSPRVPPAGIEENVVSRRGDPNTSMYRSENPDREVCRHFCISIF